MNKAIPFLLLIFMAFWVHAGASAKKNLCTVTINSSDEADLFKKRLSPSDWNFIELTPTGLEAETKNWFKAACKKKIECDVLVISGHFAGSFFGKTKFTLPIEELEALSCDQDCSGILNRPKEVFLFGCNTLATKEKDLRSPEEYMQVLRDDGFTAAQASQVVSFRYSGFGESFKNRMSSIFPKTPQIYGFSSKGPSGATVSEMLDTYLLKSQSDYKNFDTAKSKNFTAKNEKLFSALKGTSLVQTSGLLPKMATVDEKPYCYVRSPQVTRIEKIKYIEKLLESDEGIQMISHIEDFIHELKSSDAALSEGEKVSLQHLSNNEKIKTQLLSLFKLNGEIYIPLKVHILNTLKDLEIVTTDFVESTFNQLIELKTPFTASRKDMICSSNFTANIPIDIIPQKRWAEVDFIISLICLHPKNLDLHHRMIEKLNSPDPVIRGTIIWFFYGSQTNDLEIQMALAQKLSADPENYIRMSAAAVLRGLPIDSLLIKKMIADALVLEKDENVIHSIKDCLAQIK